MLAPEVVHFPPKQRALQQILAASDAIVFTKVCTCAPTRSLYGCVFGLHVFCCLMWLSFLLALQGSHSKKKS